MKFGALRVLRHRNYATIWCGGFLSDLGTWMQIAALGIFAVQATNEAMWVGILTTVTYVASGFLFPFGGVAADRYDRRKLIASAATCQAVVAFALWFCFVSDHKSLFLIASLAAIQGGLSSIVHPAWASMNPDLVPTNELPQAAAMEHVSWNIGRAVGPLLAVGVLALTSYEGVFVINGASFMFLAIGALTISLPHHNIVEHGSAFQRVKTGLTGLRDSAACHLPVKVAVLEMILLAPFIALIPAMAQIVLHGDSSDTAHLYAAQGIGSAVGVVLIASLAAKIGQERVMLGALFVMTFVGIAYATSGSAIIALLMILPLSALHASTLAGSMSLLQRDAPPNIRGRIISIQLALTNVGYGFSSWLQATLADHFGLRSVYAGSCVLGLLIAGTFLLHRRRIQFNIDLQTSTLFVEPAPAFVDTELPT